MTVHETVGDIVNFTRTTVPMTQDEWYLDRKPGVWLDEDTEDRLCIARCDWTRAHTMEEWAAHPATVPLPVRTPSSLDPAPEVALASWVLDDGALEAVLAAEVAPDYARAAHRAGVTDAWELIELWRSGVPVEYLNAL